MLVVDGVTLTTFPEKWNQAANNGKLTEEQIIELRAYYCSADYPGKEGNTTYWNIYFTGSTTHGTMILRDKCAQNLKSEAGITKQALRKTITQKALRAKFAAKCAAECQGSNDHDDGDDAAGQRPSLKQKASQAMKARMVPTSLTKSSRIGEGSPGTNSNHTPGQDSPGPPWLDKWRSPSDVFAYAALLWKFQSRYA